MEAKQLIELVQQHHPHIGETEALILLNQVMREFCEDTKMTQLLDTTIDTVKDTRWYTIPNFNTQSTSTSHLISIDEIYIDDVKIPRLQGNPKIDDGS
tara:strand:+ start:781 stop:1074 length:294 start_codon:yes stop_codon:yes gene_type:complete